MNPAKMQYVVVNSQGQFYQGYGRVAVEYPAARKVDRIGDARTLLAEAKAKRPSDWVMVVNYGFDTQRIVG